MGDKGQWNMKEGENSENALMEIRTAEYGFLKVKDELEKLNLISQKVYSSFH